MSGNQLQPIAYAYTSNGVFCSNDGTNFVTGIGTTATRDQLGTVVVVYSNSIFFGNSSVNATINSTIYTGNANNGGGGGGTPGGSNTNIQFNDSGSFGGNSLFVYSKVNNTVSIADVTIAQTGIRIGNAVIQRSFIELLPDANGNMSVHGLLGFLAANSLGNAFATSDGFYWNGNAGTALPNSQASINSTWFTGTSNNANNSAYLGGVLAASYLTSIPTTYIQNTDSRVLSGNVEFSGANIVFDTLITIGAQSGAAGNGVVSNTTTTRHGNATVFSTINATNFSQTANNALNLGGVTAASYLTSVPATYVQNADSRTMSGNLNFTAANVNFSTGWFVSPAVSANTTLIVAPSYKSTVPGAVTSAWGMDFSGSSMTVAGGGSNTIVDGSGLLILTDGTISGQTAMYVVGGSSTVSCILVAGGGIFVTPTTTPAAGKMSIGFDGTHYRVYNGNSTISVTFYVASIRTRPTT